ncbi:MAG: family containing protein [Actinoallomurus sp.]|nr:family containing protein [Actinoallomurus sp.]
MIYELREYVAVPGQAAAVHARFADQTLGLFARHGIDVVGFWSDQEDSDRIVYLLSFADTAAQRSAWAGFQNDPDWQRVKAESEADGKIVAEIHSRTLDRTPYWPHETIRAAADHD